MSDNECIAEKFNKTRSAFRIRSLRLTETLKHK